MSKLSLEYSAKFVGDLQAGISPSKVADMFAINKTTVYWLKAKFEEVGTLNRPKESGGQERHLKNKTKKLFKRKRKTRS